eukprot:2744142-Rhodomonas_salina.1
MYTGLWKELETAGIVGKFFFVADAAYCNNVAVCTPFTRTERLSEDQKNFNFYLSQVRIEVECAFGILVQRFGIFWRGLRAGLANASRIVSACVRLHNFCIDEGDTTSDPDIEVPEYEGYLCPHGPGCTRGRCRSNAVRARNDDSPVLNQHGGPAALLRYSRGELDPRELLGGGDAEQNPTDNVPRNARDARGPRQRDRTDKIRAEM